MTTASPGWQFCHAYLRGSYGALALSVPLSIGQLLAILPITVLVRQAFDGIIPAGDVPGLMLIGGQMLGLYVVNVVLMLASRRLVLMATKRAIMALRTDFLRRCYEWSWSSFRAADTSRLHSVIVNDTERVDSLCNALVGIILPELLISISLCIVLVALDPLLFGILIVALPFLVFPSRYLAWRAREETRTFHTDFEQFSGVVVFALRAMELTRIQGAEPSELARQGRRIEALRGSSSQMVWLFVAQGAVQRTILAASGVLILIVGGQAVAAGSLSLGRLISFSVATALLVTHLSAALAALPHVIVGREALASLLRFWRDGGAQPYRGTRRIPFRGEIRATGVTFQYGDRPLLQGVDLALAPRTMTALLGPNGAGKSTLLQLLLGFYRPQAGHLLADGLAYDDLDLVELRRGIGVVPQDPCIFPGTVLENITYGSPSADLAAATRAATLALAHEFITQLPDGYEARVGEGGVALSGGQRQRLALVREPVLLLLDEPGNHLDRATLREIVQNVRGGAHPPAMLIVTHDGDVASWCDVVYVLEHGRIVSDAPVTTAGASSRFGNL